jgi:hypothetical protein
MACPGIVIEAGSTRQNCTLLQGAQTIVARLRDDRLLD